MINYWDIERLGYLELEWQMSQELFGIEKDIPGKSL